MKIKNRRLFMATALCAGLVAVVASGAQSAKHGKMMMKTDAESVIKARKAAMKEVVLKGLKASKQMIKDDFFDADEAAGHMNKIAEVAAGFSKHFPKGTESGFKTTAKPEIWSKRTDFDARLVKLASDAKAAAAAAKKGFADFKTAFKGVAKNCKGCHETYRVKEK